MNAYPYITNFIGDTHIDLSLGSGRNELKVHFEGNVAAHENSINALDPFSPGAWRKTSSIFHADARAREILLIPNRTLGSDLICLLLKKKHCRLLSPVSIQSC